MHKLAEHKIADNQIQLRIELPWPYLGTPPNIESGHTGETQAWMQFVWTCKTSDDKKLPDKNKEST